MVMEIIIATVVILVLLFLLAMSVRIIRPTEFGLVERLGKFRRGAEQGFHIIIPLMERMITVNITEQMVDAEAQEVITADNLNAKVDAQVYFRVKPNIESVKRSQYNVANYYHQIVQLARTTLRDIIGKMSFKDVNSKRDKLNNALATELDEQTDAWGIQIVRTELKEIEPPKDVQDTMNKVLKAENEKIAANDYATARETEADGKRRAEIKVAEGQAKAVELRAGAEKKAIILKAQGEAKAIKQVNESAQKYFKDQAVEYKKLLTAAQVFKKNSKFIVPDKVSFMSMFSQLSELESNGGGETSKKTKKAN